MAYEGLKIITAQRQAGPMYSAAAPQAARASAPAPTARAATPAAPATVSALALSLAIQAERTAIVKLFGHAGAKARVGGLCSELARGVSAGNLLARLNAGTLLTDAQISAEFAQTNASSASASWAKVIAKLNKSQGL